MYSCVPKMVMPVVTKVRLPVFSFYIKTLWYTFIIFVWGRVSNYLYGLYKSTSSSLLLIICTPSADDRTVDRWWLVLIRSNLLTKGWGLLACWKYSHKYYEPLICVNIVCFVTLVIVNPSVTKPCIFVEFHGTRKRILVRIVNTKYFN